MSIAQHAPICPHCDKRARLVTGNVIYPHRADLFAKKFWQCAPCDAYVGCHENGCFVRSAAGDKIMSDGTLPMGRLANAALRREKQRAHAAFDPLWRSKRMTRRAAYAWLAGQLGVSLENCHIGMFDADGCRAVVAAVKRLSDGDCRRAA